MSNPATNAALIVEARTPLTTNTRRDVRLALADALEASEAENEHLQRYSGAREADIEAWKARAFESEAGVAELRAQVARVRTVCAEFDQGDRLNADGTAHAFRRQINAALDGDTNAGEAKL